jgi:hypothetical protein
MRGKEGSSDPTSGMKFFLGVFDAGSGVSTVIHGFFGFSSVSLLWNIPILGLAV